MYNRDETMRILNDTIGDVCNALESVHLLIMGSGVLNEPMTDECKGAYDALEIADEKLSWVFNWLDTIDE